MLIMGIKLPILAYLLVLENENEVNIWGQKLFLWLAPHPPPPLSLTLNLVFYLSLCFFFFFIAANLPHEIMSLTDTNL